MDKKIRAAFDRNQEVIESLTKQVADRDEHIEKLQKNAEKNAERIAKRQIGDSEERLKVYLKALEKIADGRGKYASLAQKAIDKGKP